ncbi:hypothetical protein GPECTOR_64g104 [Gonium pectorale]|uniref:Translation initiation factor eIF2B subunit gamma n=1 Tax=Gonium pectorale TaxID=33097 RepID=A0A150G5K8_GONPE|nr:hypothetical protein GPECTOR_64g104 [Gonium pectorale]|eukprot:KXZ44610.1 hypothetical protein GPECTOR_64g104 [Gonium pectorale]
MVSASYQAVVLAGGEDQILYPLTTNTVKALLPVANKPLISYPLRTLAEAGLHSAIVVRVVIGERAAASVREWIATEYSGSPGALQCERKTSPAAETKPGKPPKNVDYIGLDPSRQHLLFYAASQDSLRDLRLPLHIVRRYGTMSISSNFFDAHLYVFSRCGDAASDLRFSLVSELPGSHFMSMSHGPAGRSAPESLLRVQLVGPSEAYVARVQDVQAYGEVNREVADPGVALKLSGLRPGRFDNIVPPSASLGNKATVGAGCILGEGCAVGDKSSIKRSVLGAGCRLGANVKVINSVLMDGVVLADGVHVQNSVLCRGAAVQAGATLKDCQVGPGCSVAGGVEHKSEVLVTKGAGR